MQTSPLAAAQPVRADDRAPFTLLTGQRIDPAAPWPLDTRRIEARPARVPAQPAQPAAPARAEWTTWDRVHLTRTPLRTVIVAERDHQPLNVGELWGGQ